MGRTDDIINVAGHRLSTGQMEQIVAGVDGVAECAVIGADDAIKGMIPVAFVVPKRPLEPKTIPRKGLTVPSRSLREGKRAAREISKERSARDVSKCGLHHQHTAYHCRGLTPGGNLPLSIDPA